MQMETHMEYIKLCIVEDMHNYSPFLEKFFLIFFRQQNNLPTTAFRLLSQSCYFYTQSKYLEHFRDEF